MIGELTLPFHYVLIHWGVDTNKISKKVDFLSTKLYRLVRDRIFIFLFWGFLRKKSKLT
jgi:hypothetical protein